MIKHINSYHILLGCIVVFGAFLRFYKLPEFMMFIGDYAWFYVSARDMLLTWDIPLVGITASHTWLHQGALWTYMLAPVLWLSHFHPLSGGYFVALIGVGTVFLIYKVGSEMFSKRIGIITALFYASSPLIILNSRTPYHTAPIPLFTLLLFYFTWKWIQEGPYIFPYVILFLAILYNFELATFTLAPIIVLLLIFGFVKKKKWAVGLCNKKIIFLSFLAWLIPMLPMIIYDFHHGFPQTVKFLIWVAYKIATAFGYPSLHPATENIRTMLSYNTIQIQRLLFLPNALIAFIILLAGIILLFSLVFQSLKKRKYNSSYSLLLLFFSISAIGYITTKTYSDAYLPIFFPSVMFIVGIFFSYLMNNVHLKVLSIILLAVIVSLNVQSLLAKNYFIRNGYGASFSERMKIAQEIIKRSGNNQYNLIGRGEGSKYQSFLMSHEYLTWWLGHPPSKQEAEKKFIIEEHNDKIILGELKNKL